MSDDQITNGRRAARALDAISTYTRMSPYEGLPEDYFSFLDSERETGPGTDHDCLADVLCGLTHVGSTAGVLDRVRTATGLDHANARLPPHLTSIGTALSRTTEGEHMSQPDSGQPANASGPSPYGPPDQVPGYPDPDDRTAPHQEPAPLRRGSRRSRSVGHPARPRGTSGLARLRRIHSRAGGSVAFGQPARAHALCAASGQRPTAPLPCAPGHDRGAAAGHLRGRRQARRCCPAGPSTCPRPPAREPLRPAVPARRPPRGTPATADRLPSRSPRRLPRRRPSASCPATGR